MSLKQVTKDLSGISMDMWRIVGSERADTPEKLCFELGKLSIQLRDKVTSLEKIVESFEDLEMDLETDK